MGTPVGDRDNLIMAVQTGDTTAPSRLLVACQADARRHAYKHCHASDVDDAVQESLLIISRKVSGLKAADAFSSWLFTVIKHECRKLARMMLKREPLPDEMAEELLLHRPDDELRIDLVKCPGVVACPLSRSGASARLRGVDHRRDRHPARRAAWRDQEPTAPRP